MKFPAYRPNKKKLMAEGRYQFQIADEPECRQGRQGGGYLILKLEIIFKDGSRKKFNTIMIPWEKNYGDLLLALGGEKDAQGNVELNEIDLLGKQFWAEIYHFENPNNPSIMWEKLKNIRTQEMDEDFY